MVFPRFSHDVFAPPWRPRAVVPLQRGHAARPTSEQGMPVRRMENSGLMGFDGDLMLIYGDLMVIYGDLMVIYGDLWWFNGKTIGKP